ncbi:MAG: homoserine dehydrogenase [Clostridia bacterium]|nr:homoserine dehydrogenase [Clostridia bacterium]NCC74842.1 homoserine dehydrogenase [Clostridia bacterium]
MINIAILGYGVVGSGVGEVIYMNQSSLETRTGQRIDVKKILDLREFPQDPYGDRVTRSADEIMDDPEISVVVETIGGVSIAYELTKRALKAGKHVVTSNKELVATHGPELMALADANNVSYLFEASVGGGIPIIRPLHKCLAANVVLEISGILNGTTNYILTRMEHAGIDFDAALKEAQERGYAEQNPTADIAGIDACRKIAILASIVTGEYIDSRQIHTEGITTVTLSDMAYARSLNRKVKLLGRFLRNDGQRYNLIVAPMLVDLNTPLSVADDVFNAILVRGNALGTAMFYGRGAGKLPTASAVVADVIECVMHLGKKPHVALWQDTGRENILGHDLAPVQALIRLDPQVPRPYVESMLDPFGLDWLEPVVPGEIACTVGFNPENPLLEGQLSELLSNLGDHLAGWMRLCTCDNTP